MKAIEKHSNEWKLFELGSIVTKSKEKHDPKNQPSLPCIELEHIDQEDGSINGWAESKDLSSTKNRFHPGEVLFGKLRPYLRKFWLAEFEGVCSSEIWVLKSNEDLLLKEYLFFLVQSHRFIQAANVTSGSKMPRADWDYMVEVPFHLPSTKEQEDIAELISTWDKAIKNLSSSLSLLKTRKKGFMQQIFKGTLRLKGKDGTEYPKWKPKKLSHYLKVSKAKNEDLKYTEDDVLSVSGEYGIVNQIEFHGRSFAGASVANYGVVETGDIVYTKSPLKANPYGIIKVNKGQAGIVSTLYAIYKCKPTVNGEFVDYYFQLDDNVNRYLRPLVQKGTKNDMKINNEKVLIDEVLFPSLEEQNAIVDFFKTIDHEITQTKEYLESLKKQKKGLMQKLLTGEIRVKTGNE